jgi:hypothetical protein
MLSIIHYSYILGSEAQANWLVSFKQGFSLGIADVSLDAGTIKLLSPHVLLSFTPSANRL